MHGIKPPESRRPLAKQERLPGDKADAALKTVEDKCGGNTGLFVSVALLMIFPKNKPLDGAESPLTVMGVLNRLGKPAAFPITASFTCYCSFCLYTSPPSGGVGVAQSKLAEAERYP